MKDFMEIKCLSPDEQKKILDEIKASIAQKKKDGILLDKEIREIEEMKLSPLLDIQDIQSVLEDHLFKEKRKS